MFYISKITIQTISENSVSSDSIACRFHSTAHSRSHLIPSSTVNPRLLLLLNWETWRDPNLTSSSAVVGWFFSFPNLAISQFAFISLFSNTQTAERSGKKDCARLGGGCMGHIHIVKFSRPISETAKQKKAWSRKSDKVLFSSALQLQAQSIIHWRCRHSTTKWRRSDVWWAGNYLHHDVFINKL